MRVLLSSSESSFVVDPAAPTQAPVIANTLSAATATDLMTYIVGATTAIITAIAIAGFLMLRKKS